MKRENDKFFDSLDDELKSLYCSVEDSLSDYKCDDIDLKSAVMEILINCLEYTDNLMDKQLERNEEKLNQIHNDGIEVGFSLLLNFKNENDTRIKKPD
jgi:hypothetical protein